MDMQPGGEVHLKSLLSLMISVKSAPVYPFGLEEQRHSTALINSIPFWREGIKSVEGAECEAFRDRQMERVSQKISKVPRSYPDC